MVGRKIGRPTYLATYLPSCLPTQYLHCRSPRRSVSRATRPRRRRKSSALCAKATACSISSANFRHLIIERPLLSLIFWSPQLNFYIPHDLCVTSSAGVFGSEALRETGATQFTSLQAPSRSCGSCAVPCATASSRSATSRSARRWGRAASGACASCSRGTTCPPGAGGRLVRHVEGNAV